MPRLVHVLPGLRVGGAERALERLLRAGLSRAYETHVISMGGDGEMRRALEAAGAQVHWRRSRSTLGAPAFLYARLRQLRPDIVQAWMYHANLATAIGRVLCILNAPVVWNIRQSLAAPSKDRPRTRAVIRAGALVARASEAIVYNSALARAHHEAIGYPTERGVLIPNGFLPPAPPDPRATVNLLAALEIPTGSPVVIHVARFHPVKDHRTFVQAAVRIAAIAPEPIFVMVGRDVEWSNGDLIADIPAEYRTRFRLLGERQDIAQLLRASDIFVLTSLAEAFPNALGEAMAAGLACVATNVGDVRQLISGHGRVVAPGDVEAVISAVLDYVTDEAARHRDGAHASTHIAGEYGLEAAVSRYTALYESALARYRKQT